MVAIFSKNNLVQRWFTEDYTRMLKRCLPKGPIWLFEKYTEVEVIQDVISGDTWQDVYENEDEVIQDVIRGDGSGSVLMRLLSCFAEEFRRCEAEVIRIVNSTDPGVATDLLPDWERVLGLPENCLKGVEQTLEERQRSAHGKMFDTGRTTNKSFFEEYAESLGYDVTIEELPAISDPRIMGVARMGVQRMGNRGGYSVLKVIVNGSPPSTELLKCSFDREKQAHVVIIYEE